MAALSTISNNALLKLLLLLPLAAFAEDAEIEWGGHSKTRFLADIYPDNSAFHALTGKTASSLDEELRVNFSAGKGQWTFQG